MSIKLQGISVPSKLGRFPQSMYATLEKPDNTTSIIVLKGDIEDLKQKSFLELEQLAIQQFEAEHAS